jgi:hypothetical protein
VMDRETRKRVVRLLHRLGFDGTRSFRSGAVRPGCSQCQALVIQGAACHETGCPNRPRASSRRR